MDQSDASNLCFKDVTWLQHFSLTVESALDYFSQSPFYDRSCNNELVKMQTKFSNLSQSCLTEKLESMKGIEFSLVHSVVPTLFVIRRQERISPAVALPISSFYIVDGTIYQSPDLYSVLANRLNTAVHFLNEAANICKAEAESQKDQNSQPKSNLQSIKSTNILDLKDKAIERALIEHSLKDFSSKGRNIYPVNLQHLH